MRCSARGFGNDRGKRVRIRSVRYRSEGRYVGLEGCDESRTRYRTDGNSRYYRRSRNGYLSARGSSNVVGDDGFVNVVSRREREVLRPVSIRCRHRLSSYGKTRDSSGVRNASREGGARSFGGASIRMRYDAHGRGDSIDRYVCRGVRYGTCFVGKGHENVFISVSGGKRYVKIRASASGNASGMRCRNVSGDFVIDGFACADPYGRSGGTNVRPTEERYRSAGRHDRFSYRREGDGSGVSKDIHYES